MSKLAGTSRLTVRKILLDAPIYDMLAEVREHKRLEKPYQTSPHKREGELSKIEQQKLDFIKHKQTGATNAS